MRGKLPRVTELRFMCVCVCVAQDRSIALTAQQHHPKDSDAEWNSNQHPTWPQALSEEFDPAVNK